MPSATRLEPVNAYMADIQGAGTESAKKERLIVLLKDLFPSAEADVLIRDFVAGAERGADGGTLPAHRLGRLRSEIRDFLSKELQAVDAALRRIWKTA